MEPKVRNQEIHAKETKSRQEEAFTTKRNQIENASHEGFGWWKVIQDITNQLLIK